MDGQNPAPPMKSWLKPLLVGVHCFMLSGLDAQARQIPHLLVGGLFQHCRVPSILTGAMCLLSSSGIFDSGVSGVNVKSSYASMCAVLILPLYLLSTKVAKENPKTGFFLSTEHWARDFDFRQFGLHQLKTAYQLTAMSMVLGNGLYAWSCAADYGLPALFAARALTGLGAGAMYNTAMVMVHFARGSQKTG